MSSPPARGSSRDGGEHLRRGSVVPASAGIVRTRGPQRRCPRRRPRQRGDRPVTLHFQTRTTESSPPARGSSRPGGEHLRRGSVVPASAGIVRSRTVRAATCGSRPRQRGDRPRVYEYFDDGILSSPPARGSSSAPRPAVMASRVVPASAGIVRSAGPRYSVAPRRPRQRGDRPRTRGTVNGSGSSSPPARGSSIGWHLLTNSRGVVPASAGIVRCTGSAPPGC